MKIGVLCESSSAAKNPDIVAALEGRGHEILNIGMRGPDDPAVLNYIHTSFMAGLLLHLKAVDLIVSGCGTGQGFAIGACQYPGVFCGQIRNALDAWLFAYINNGNAISLSLNKDYGWAADVDLKFIFDAYFSAEGGAGYPAHRRQVQQQARELLYTVSEVTHRTFPEILQQMEPEVLRQCAKNEMFMTLVRAASDERPAKRIFLERVGA